MATAKAKSEGAPDPKSLPGVRVRGMRSRFDRGTQETLRGLKGNRVDLQDPKIKQPQALLLKGVRSFDSSEDVGNDH